MPHFTTTHSYTHTHTHIYILPLPSELWHIHLESVSKFGKGKDERRCCERRRVH